MGFDAKKANEDLLKQLEQQDKEFLKKQEEEDKKFIENYNKETMSQIQAMLDSQNKANNELEKGMKKAVKERANIIKNANGELEKESKKLSKAQEQINNILNPKKNKITAKVGMIDTSNYVKASQNIIDQAEKISDAFDQASISAGKYVENIKKEAKEINDVDVSNVIKQLLEVNKITKKQSSTKSVKEDIKYHLMLQQEIANTEKELNKINNWDTPERLNFEDIKKAAYHTKVLLGLTEKLQKRQNARPELFIEPEINDKKLIKMQNNFAKLYGGYEILEDGSNSYRKECKALTYAMQPVINKAKELAEAWKEAYKAAKNEGRGIDINPSDYSEKKMSVKRNGGYRKKAVSPEALKAEKYITDSAKEVNAQKKRINKILESVYTTFDEDGKTGTAETKWIEHKITSENKKAELIGKLSNVLRVQKMTLDEYVESNKDTDYFIDDYQKKFLESLLNDDTFKKTSQQILNTPVQQVVVAEKPNVAATPTADPKNLKEINALLKKGNIERQDAVDIIERYNKLSKVQKNALEATFKDNSNYRNILQILKDANGDAERLNVTLDGIFKKEEQIKPAKEEVSPAIDENALEQESSTLDGLLQKLEKYVELREKNVLISNKIEENSVDGYRSSSYVEGKKSGKQAMIEILSEIKTLQEEINQLDSEDILLNRDKNKKLIELKASLLGMHDSYSNSLNGTDSYLGKNLVSEIKLIDKEFENLKLNKTGYSDLFDEIKNSLNLDDNGLSKLASIFENAKEKGENALQIFERIKTFAETISLPPSTTTPTPAVEQKPIETQVKLFDEIGAEIDENNSKLLEGTKLINEQNNGILKLYNNSNKIFDKFSLDQSGKNQGNSIGKGVYLSTHAKGEYNDAAFGKFQTEWYAKVINPLVLQAVNRMDNSFTEVFDGFSEEIIQKLFKEYYDGKTPVNEGYLRGKLSGSYGLFDGLNVIGKQKNQSPVDILKFLGYDSVIKGGEINVFDPENVVRANGIIKALDGTVLSLEEATRQANELSDVSEQIKEKYEAINGHTLDESSTKEQFQEHISMLKEILPLLEQYSSMMNGKKYFSYYNENDKYRNVEKQRIQDSIENYTQVMSNRFPDIPQIESKPVEQVATAEEHLVDAAADANEKLKEQNKLVINSYDELKSYIEKMQEVYDSIERNAFERLYGGSFIGYDRRDTLGLIDLSEYDDVYASYKNFDYLSDKLKEIYNLYNKLKDAINSNKGYFNGEQYDVNDLERLETLFKSIAQAYHELDPSGFNKMMTNSDKEMGIVDSTIKKVKTLKQLTSSMSKQFKEYVDIVIADTKATNDNQKAYEKETKRLREVNDEKSKLYENMRDSLLSTVSDKDKQYYISDYIPTFTFDEDYSMMREFGYDLFDKKLNVLEEMSKILGFDKSVNATLQLSDEPVVDLKEIESELDSINKKASEFTSQMNKFDISGDSSSIKQKISEVDQIITSLTELKSQVSSISIPDTATALTNKQNGATNLIDNLLTSFEPMKEKLVEKFNSIDLELEKKEKEINENVANFIQSINNIKGKEHAEPSWMTEYIEKIQKDGMSVEDALDKYKNKLSAKIKEVQDAEEKDAERKSNVTRLHGYLTNVNNFEDTNVALEKYGDLLAKVSAGEMDFEKAYAEIQKRISNTNKLFNKANENLELYHWSNKNFDKFDVSMAGSNGHAKTGVLGTGAYVATNPIDWTSEGNILSKWKLKGISISDIFDFDKMTLTDEQIEKLLPDVPQEKIESFKEYAKQVGKVELALRRCSEGDYAETLSKLGYKGASKSNGKIISIFDADNLEKVGKSVKINEYDKKEALNLWNSTNKDASITAMKQLFEKGQSGTIADIKSESEDVIIQIDKVIDKCKELKEADKYARTTRISSSMRGIKEALSSEDFDIDNISEKHLIKLGKEFFKLQGAVENEASEMANGVKEYVGGLLDKFGVELVDMTGQRFDVGFAVNAISSNAPKDTPDDKLVYSEMIEPMIKINGAVRSHGKAILDLKDKQQQEQQQIESNTASIENQTRAVEENAKAKENKIPKSLDFNVEDLDEKALKKKIDAANKAITNNSSTADLWKEKLPSMQEAYEKLVAQREETERLAEAEKKAREEAARAAAEQRKQNRIGSGNSDIIPDDWDKISDTKADYDEDPLRTVKEKTSELDSSVQKVIETWTAVKDEDGNLTGEMQKSTVKIIDDFKKRTDAIEGEAKKVAHIQSTIKEFMTSFDSKTAGKGKELTGYNDLNNFQVTKSSDLDTVKNMMLDLNSEYNKVSSDFRKGAASLDPFVNAINSSKKMDYAIKNLELDFIAMGKTSEELGKKVDNVFELKGEFDKANNIYEMAEAFGNLRVSLNDAREAMRTEKKEQGIATADVRKDTLRTNVEGKFIDLSNFEESLKESGKLTDEVKSKIDNLFDSLTKVSSSPEMTNWNSKFSLLRKEVSSIPSDFETAWNNTLNKINSAQGKELDKTFGEKNIQKYIDNSVGIGHSAINSDALKGSFKGTEWTGAMADESNEVLKTFDELLSKVNDLKSARIELQKIYSNARKNPYTDYSEEIQRQKDLISSLIGDIKELNSNDFINKNEDILGEENIRKYADALNAAESAAKNIDVDSSRVAVENLKSAFDDLTSSYVRFASISKGKKSFTLTEDLQQIKLAENQIKEMIQQAQDAVVKIEDIEKISSDAMTKLATEVGQKGSATLDEFSNKIDNLYAKLSQKGIVPDDIINKLVELKSQLLTIQSDKTNGLLNVESFQEIPGILNTYLKQIDQFGSSLDGILQNLSNNVVFTNLESQINEFSVISNEGKIKLEGLKQVIDSIRMTQDPDSKIIDISSEDIEKIQLAKQEFEKLKKLEDQFQTNKHGAIVSGTEGNITGIESATAALKEYANNTLGLSGRLEKIRTDSDSVIMSFKKQGGEIVTLTGYIEKNGNALRVLSKDIKGVSGFSGTVKSIGKDIGSYFAMYFTGYQLITKVFSKIRENISILKDYDEALTTISYTMNVTQSQLESIGDSAIQTAKDLSTSIDDAMSVYQVYANLKNTAENIASQASPTLIISNLAGETADTAADQIQSVIQAFDYGADQYMHIADVYDNISSRIAVDYTKGIEGMSAGVQVAGQTAKMAGLSFEQLSSIVASTMEATRQDGSQIGNGLKTIMTRLSKVGELSDDVDNETLSKASKSLHEIGVEVYNADGSYRKFDTIMGELSEKWESLTDAEKSNISYNIAATRQTNLLTAIMKNWKDSMEMATDATEAQGNALENQEKYQDSYRGKMQQISTQMDAFWLSLFNSNITKSFLDFLINVTKAINAFSDATSPAITLVTGLVTAIAGVTAKNGGGRDKKFSLRVFKIIICLRNVNREMNELLISVH